MIEIKVKNEKVAAHFEGDGVKVLVEIAGVLRECHKITEQIENNLHLDGGDLWLCLNKIILEYERRAEDEH